MTPEGSVAGHAKIERISRFPLNPCIPLTDNEIPLGALPDPNRLL